MSKKHDEIRGRLEHEIEHKLCIELTKRGHLCLKFVSPGFGGVPDRLVLLAGGGSLLVECKAPTKGLRRAQPRVIKLLREMGHRVEIVDTLAGVDALVASL